MKYIVFLMALTLMHLPALCENSDLNPEFIIIHKGELIKPDANGNIFIETDTINLSSAKSIVFVSLSQIGNQDIKNNNVPELSLRAFHVLGDFHSRSFYKKVGSDGTQSMSITAIVPVVSPKMKFTVSATNLDSNRQYRVIATLRIPK